MATNDINLRDQRIADIRSNQDQLKSANEAAKKAYEDAKKTLSRDMSNPYYDERRKAVDAYKTKEKAYKDSKKAVKDFNSNEDQGKYLTRAESASRSQNELMEDINSVSDQDLQSVLGESYSLGRLREDENVQNSLSAYENATNLRVQRDAATAGLQNAESSSNRALMSRLAASGVKGGLAGGALTDLAATNLRNRASLESNLALNNVAAQKDLAQFQTQISQFDLGQQTAENNLRTSARLGLAQNSQLARSGATQAELAKNMGNMSSGK